MVQNHVRWSPICCSCILDLLIDSVTGEQTLFAIRNLCDAHRPIATIDSNFDAKKAAALAKRYQDLDDNRDRNYQQIDSYTDLQMSPTDKAGCKATVDRITDERKREYDLLLSQTDSNLFFCVNVRDSINEESGRWSRVYERVKSQYNLTDDQMKAITYSYTGTAPNRMFTVNFGSLLTATQKANAQTWCNSNIGPNKVTVL